jgi:hypothetical protein
MLRYPHISRFGLLGPYRYFLIFAPMIGLSLLDTPGTSRCPVAADIRLGIVLLHA